jgi:general secretion pathway protein J
MQAGRQAGLTLLELLIALTILAFMMVIAWSTIIQTTRTKKDMESVQDRYHTVRATLGTIERDLTMAYLSSNEDQTLPDKRTMFILDQAGGSDRLTFSAFAHQRFYADAPESDQTVLSYFIADDRDKPGHKNLYRFESERLAPERWDTLPGASELLMDDISRFEVLFWNPKDAEWQEDWDTSKTDWQGRLPTRVKITIALRDEHDEEVSFVTQTFIPMQEVLQSYAN